MEMIQLFSRDLYALFDFGHGHFHIPRQTAMSYHVTETPEQLNHLCLLIYLFQTFCSLL